MARKNMRSYCQLYKPVQYLNTQSLVPELTYREFYPSTYLSGFISCYWIVETKAHEVNHIRHRILPDGCIDIVFDLIARHAFLCGLADQTEYLTLNGKIQYFGIRFLPRVISYVFKKDTAESLNGKFKLSDISKPLRQMAFSVLEKKNIIDYIRNVEHHLALFFYDYEINEKFKSLLNHTLAKKGNITVKELSRYHFISEKQIGRHFIHNTGASTKPFLRILRFQNAYQSLAAHKRSSISLALEAGYYDQSHLIKDLKHFLGNLNPCSPQFFTSGLVL